MAFSLTLLELKIVSAVNTTGTKITNFLKFPIISKNIPKIFLLLQLYKRVVMLRCDRPIDSDNKGRKMLEKMGWKQGEGLGREGGGLKEPVSDFTNASSQRTNL